MTVLFVALAAFALYGLQKLLYRKFWDRGLWASIAFEETEAQEGETCTLTEVVENRKWLPLALLKVKFETARALVFPDEEERNSTVSDLYYRNDAFTLLPYRRIRRRLPFVCTKRGIYRVMEFSLVGADLFLQTQYVKKQESETQLFVYPKRVQLPPLEQLLRQCEGEKRVSKSLIEDPFLRRGVREYVPSDDMRRVNWTATAKTGDLKVNVHESTSLSAVHVLLLLEKTAVLRKTEEEEYLIRTAATLNEELLNRGAAVFFASNAYAGQEREPLQVGAQENRAGFRTVDRALAELNLGRDCFGEKEFLEERLSGFMSSDVVLIVADAARTCALKTMENRLTSGSRLMLVSPYFGSEEPQLQTAVPVAFFSVQL